MSHTVTLIQGDGIGLEITQAVIDLFKAIDLPIDFDIHTAGAGLYEKEGVLIKDETLAAIQANKVALKGPLTTPIGTGFRSVNVELRKRFDLYANIRPIESFMDGALFDNVAMTIFRENTEDLYAGIEEKIDDDTMHSIKVITRAKSDRIIRKAFDHAQAEGIDTVTVVTKANIMKLTDGLFLQVARDVQKDYPTISLEEVLVDNMAMQMVMYPEKYNIIVTENLYGDILSDLAAGLIGGLGLVPGANIGHEIAIFEPAHGSAPDIAGQDLANPTALFLSAVMMLDHLGLVDEAARLKAAIIQTVQDPATRTRDLGGQLGTKAFTQAVINHYK